LFRNHLLTISFRTMRTGFIQFSAVLCLCAPTAGVVAAAAMICVEPIEVVLTREIDRTQLVVSIDGGDGGRTSDATAIATYESLSPGVASVSPTGQITPRTNGAAVVRVISGTMTADGRRPGRRSCERVHPAGQLH
jgi:hypothetical protein